MGNGKMPRGRAFGALALAALAVALAPAGAARGAEQIYRVDLAACAGFSARDAAPFLGVPPGKVAMKAERIHAALVTCSYAGGAGGKVVAFSIEVAPDAKAAAAQMESYRGSLEVAAETAAFKDRLPKGAYSEIGGAEGLGDENVWTDVNGSWTARKGNVTVQVTMPADKLEKIKVGQAVLAKF